jgi:small subunit ribosomal protein S21
VQPETGIQWNPERKQQASMIKVKARGNESVDQMLRRFKKMCEKEGLVKDIKRNSYYEKPSERRRRRARKSMKRVNSGR